MKFAFFFFVLLLLRGTITYAVDLSQSNLPIVIINTNGKVIKDEPKITALMSIYWTPGEINNVADAPNNYDGYIGIEKRGNSSQSWPKKPYKIETRDANGDNLNISLIGLPKENDWVLHAPYVDKTLLRNALVYRILNEMGWYAPKYRFCELIINNEYKGVYVLVESLKVDANRINIKRSSVSDLKGGYLLELTTSNRLERNEPHFETRIAEQTMAIKYPKDEDLTVEHKSYITAFFNDFEEALYNKQFSGANDYKNYINVESFIDHMLISEVFKQLDVFFASHYFYKDSAEKLVMGPGWDYNRSMGNYKGFDSWKTTGLWLTSPRGGLKPFWPEYIYQDTYFMTAYKERYAQLRDNILSTGHVYAIIDEYRHYINEAKDRNFKVWDINKNTSHKYVQGSYEGEISFVKNWLEERLNWLDKQWTVVHNPIINEFYADGEGTGNQWVELYNPSGVTINISGWKFAVDSETFTFPNNTTIAAKQYLVLVSDKAKFTAKYSGITNVFQGLKGNLLKDDLKLQLISDNLIKNELKTSVSMAWPMISKSGNYSVGMRTIAYDNTLGYNWNWSANEGGTPGASNEIFDYSGLILSEIMSVNTNSVADENNEFDDWIELSNNTNYTININGLFLSDELDDYGRWQITDPLNKGNTIIEPGKSMILWLDSDVEKQGNLHANFSVKSLGERVLLSYYDGYNYTLIDQVNPPPLLANQSYQLCDISSDEWCISDTPSPGIFANNSTFIALLADSKQIQLKVYPNPVNINFNIDFNLNEKQIITIDVLNYWGQKVMPLISNKLLNKGHYTYAYTLRSDLPDGMYLLHIKGRNFTETKKLLVVRP